MKATFEDYVIHGTIILLISINDKPLLIRHHQLILAENGSENDTTLFSLRLVIPIYFSPRNLNPNDDCIQLSNKQLPFNEWRSLLLKIGNNKIKVKI